MSKVFAFIMALFLLIGFFRLVFNIGEFRIQPVIDSLMSFDISFDDFFISIDELSLGITANTVWWNNELTGVIGFLTNLKNVIFSFFVVNFNVFFTLVRESVESLKAFFNVVFGLVRFVRSLFGF